MNTTAVDRMQGRASLTYMMQALGHHTWKAGIDIERNQYDIQKAYSGGAILRESTSGNTFSDYRQYGYFTGPDQAVQQAVLRNKPVSMNIGAYLQDSWAIMDMVTLNAGLRYENQQMFAGDGTLGLTLNNQLAPRVGLIYDFTQQGRSKLFANYARYYEQVPMDIADRSLSGENQFQFIRMRAANASRKGCFDQGAANNGNPVPSTSQATSECLDTNNYQQINRLVGGIYDVNGAGLKTGQGKTAVDPDLIPQSTDEILVGGEYEVISDGRLGVSYTHRLLNRVVEDMSLDEANTYFLGNPGYGMAAIFPKAVRDYDAVTAYFNKSFSDGWMAQVSYTWSYLRGNYNGLFRPETGQLDPNINSDFDLVSLLRNRTGPLDADRTHFIKAYAAKEFVVGGSLSFLVGLTYEGLSGRPLNYFASHGIYGPNEAFVLPRGSGGRTPWRHTINAKVGVSYRITKSNVVGFTTDVFNMFNFQAATSVDETFSTAEILPVVVTGTKTGQESICIAGNNAQCYQTSPINPNLINPNFKRPNGYQTPISVRFGLTFSF
jgi:hypothetical protein